MNHHEHSPQSAPESNHKQLALQLKNKLNASPYRLAAFREYLKKVDAGYLPDLDKLIADSESIDDETCHVLTTNFQTFEDQIDHKEHPQSHTMMGRTLHPDIAQNMNDGWQTALTEWNNRHSK